MVRIRVRVRVRFRVRVKDRVRVGMVYRVKVQFPPTIQRHHFNDM